ncbi:Relaxin receptor 2-like 4 [Homarus americanus]|uniref:Relaxin receptor 2-like 4 n=1 Tax=Homarus americanus TaxID=6706 RepID=A0A8J5TEX2_HOMAM|nr:Relaxin receptor 2-like 4 [Homarus americanus]
MTSWQCTLTGVLAMTSAEVSVLILSFMSVERWVCITWPLRHKLSLEGQGRPHLHLGTQLPFGRHPSSLLPRAAEVLWYNGLCFRCIWTTLGARLFYSALIFVGLNQIGVVLILMSYTGMFCSIRRTRANTPLSWAIESSPCFFFIVFTDCLCWTPIIILRIMALADIPITRQYQ